MNLVLSYSSAVNFSTSAKDDDRLRVTPYRRRDQYRSLVVRVEVESSVNDCFFVQQCSVASGRVSEILPSWVF